jgi:N-acetylglucosamine-6-phosphate deacetylase
MEGTEDAFIAVADHLARHGVTGFLATTVTGPWHQQVQAVRMAAQLCGRQWMHGVSEARGATVLGCHLEGPYINPTKKGAQPEQYICLPDVADFIHRLERYISVINIVTLAPELPGALDLIRCLTHNHIIPSIGHTNATYAEISEAIDAGARHVTHCYNAMRPLESREPGVVGATMARPELTAELIWDNIHVHPASCCALVNAKGPDGVILISDGIPGTGMPDGYRFSLGDLPVVVNAGTARLPDGTLAGSLLTLDRAFQNADRYSLAQRAQMSSRNASVALGLGTHKGLIAPGFDADLVILAETGSVLQTFVMGHSVFNGIGEA